MKTRQKNTFFTDGLARYDNRVRDFDLPLARYVARYKNSSVLFSRSGRSSSFFTDDSQLYLTPEEYRNLKKGERITRIIGRLDSLNSRVFEKSKIFSAVVPESNLSRQLRENYAKLRARALALAENLSHPERSDSLVKVWNISVIGAVILGMFTMTMIYKYLGQGVSAEIKLKQAEDQARAAQTAGSPAVAEEAPDAENKNGEYPAADFNSIIKILGGQDENNSFERELRSMVKGYPIEKMVPLIAKQDRVVAAFLISIAKQESDWGKHVPLYKGEDCWNYWGFRGKNPVGTGGHTCFDSQQDAVETVAKRIKFLVSNEKLNTPEKMIIWKCGDCSWDNTKDMRAWINTVSTYFHKLNAKR